MRQLSFIVISCMLIISCTPAMMAVESKELQNIEPMQVKGRRGFLVKQKLTFGDFETINVHRSWIKGSSWGSGMLLDNDWVERLSMDFIRRRQTVRFSLKDTNGNESEVTAFSKVKWADLTIGNSNSVVNVIGNTLQIGDGGTNTFVVRIILSQNEAAWELLLDNNAVQRKAKTYTGLLAKSKSEYYTIVPVYKMRNKHGKAVSLPFGGSAGFEFRNPQGETAAAVSLVDNGLVYLSPFASAKERFLLANAASAVLLQEQLDLSA